MDFTKAEFNELMTLRMVVLSYLNKIDGVKYSIDHINNIIYIDNTKEKYKIKLKLYKNDKWCDVKKYIEKAMIKEKICEICNEDYKGKTVRCRKCNNSCCGECYINIFTQNKGIIKCPYCRNEYGGEIPEPFLQLAILDIKRKMYK